MPSHRHQVTLGGACGRRQPRHGSIHQGFSFELRASLNQGKKIKKKSRDRKGGAGGNEALVGGAGVQSGS
jgi:hypothetical protein